MQEEAKESIIYNSRNLIKVLDKKDYTFGQLSTIVEI